MTNILVRNFSISLDGYGAGPSQDVEHPLGIGGNLLHEWIFATRSGRQMIGADAELKISTTLSSRRAIRRWRHDHGSEHVRPLRGPWGENEWSGWWGKSRPFTIRIRTHALPAALD